MALYTLEEFASYVQSDVDTATSLLLRDLVTGVIDETATFTTYPVRVKAIGLEVAARAYRNPDGVTSRTTAIDDYSTTDRWDAATAGVYLTSTEAAEIRSSARTTPGRALWTQPTTRAEYGDSTIYVPTAPEPSGYPFPWYADETLL